MKTGVVIIVALIIGVACTGMTEEERNLAMSRCDAAPTELVNQISGGLMAGSFSRLERVYIVENNDDRPWRFIGGAIYASGMDGEEAVWATMSLDLDKQPLLVAANYMGG